MMLKDIEGFVPTWKTSDHHPKETDGYEEGFDDGVLFVMEMLDKAPTVDAVEVVRCKDCRWIANPFCPLYKHPTHSYYDFCSYGERKEASE